MHASQSPSLHPCNSQAIRQAARHVGALYDQALAPYGLRSTQFSILARLSEAGPWSVQALAARMVMDRTTLGRAILPLERDGLVAVSPDPADRRVRIIALTPAGAARHAEARTGWAQAQARYEAAIGAERAARLRAELNEVAAARF